MRRDQKKKFTWWVRETLEQAGLSLKDSDFGATVRIIGLCVNFQGLKVLNGLLGKKISVFPS